MAGALAQGDVSQSHLGASGFGAPVRRAFSSAKPTLGGAVIATIWTALLLAPFIDKAYHLDDPFYIWVGQQILSDPTDFYGFEVNWNGKPEHVAEINKNPPLVSYYVALIGGLFGWGERTMHLAFLLPAIGATLGTYWLASRLCMRPLLAALISAATPVFAISASNVMAEVLMLALYLWASYCWLRGLSEDDARLLLLGSVLAALATLTKYFGISAFPLFLVVAAVKLRRPGTWMLAWAAGLVIVGLYEWYTNVKYGQGHLSAAVLFANEYRDDWANPRPLWLKLVVGLSFAGGCAISMLFFLPLLGRWRVAGFCALTSVLLTGGIVWFARDRFMLSGAIGEVNLEHVFQLAVFVGTGLVIASIAGIDFWRNRTSEGVFLFLLTLGSFVFAVYFNWSVNGRSLIPLAPAVAILIVRALFANPASATDRSMWRYAVPLLPLAMLSSALLYADYRLASASRSAALYYCGMFKGDGGTLWYQGHWGFQYYMDANGAKHWDSNTPRVEAGDIMVTNIGNTSTYPVDPSIIQDIHEHEAPTCSWIATWNPNVGAAFYSDGFGILPYVMTSVPAEKSFAFRLNFTGSLELSQQNATDGNVDEAPATQ